MLDLDLLCPPPPPPPQPHFCGHSCPFHGGQSKSPLPVPSEFGCLSTPVTSRCDHSCQSHGTQPIHETRTFFEAVGLTASLTTTGPDGNSSDTTIELMLLDLPVPEDYTLKIADRSGRIYVIYGPRSIQITTHADGETSVVVRALRWLAERLSAIGFGRG